MIRQVFHSFFITKKNRRSMGPAHRSNLLPFPQASSRILYMPTFAHKNGPRSLLHTLSTKYVAPAHRIAQVHRSKKNQVALSNRNRLLQQVPCDHLPLAQKSRLTIGFHQTAPTGSCAQPATMANHRSPRPTTSLNEVRLLIVPKDHVSNIPHNSAS